MVTDGVLVRVSHRVVEQPEEDRKRYILKMYIQNNNQIKEYKSRKKKYEGNERLRLITSKTNYEMKRMKS